MSLAIPETPPRPALPAPLPTGLRRLLDELESLLLILPPESADVSCAGALAPVGRHIDRSLDLVEALVHGARARVIVYTPGDPIPLDWSRSLRRIRALRPALHTWPGRSLDAVVRVQHVAYPLDLVEHSWSTLRNELAFTVNQVVDSQRVVGRMLPSCGVSLPEGFGTMELQPLRARSSVPPPWALWRLLDELDALLYDVPLAVYRGRCAGQVSGSIGEHVRHCLDHVSALVAVDTSTTLSYDRRQRGTMVETDPVEAQRRILDLKTTLEAWASRSLDEPVHVVAVISTSGDAVTAWSTLARELAFVVSHTIHHQALIGLLLAAHGQTVPDRFGHSPSTPRKH